MPYLSKITIDGYKSIRSVQLTLNRLNVLIGANGSGKSNFISIFRLLNEVILGDLQNHVGRMGGASTLFHHGTSVTQKIAISLEFDMENGWRNGYEATWELGNSDTLFFVDERFYMHDTSRFPEPYSIALGTGHKETLLRQEAKKQADRRVTAVDYVIQSVTTMRVYHFHDTRREAFVKQTGDLNDNAQLKYDAANLAAYLYFLKEIHPEYYRRIIATIRLVAPFFDDFILRPSPLNPDKIRLEWREKGSDAYFDAHALSDGTLRFICLSTLLLQPNLPTLVLIDEPELGLHPYAITLLAEMLQSAATKTQVIVSTQSVSLINQFIPEDILVLDREERESTFKRLDVKSLTDWLQDYGLGELWERNILGGRPQPVKIGS